MKILEILAIIFYSFVFGLVWCAITYITGVPFEIIFGLLFISAVFSLIYNHTSEMFLPLITMSIMYFGLIKIIDGMELFKYVQ